jgi:hypothetical protein
MLKKLIWSYHYAGVQSINNVYAIVNKVENQGIYEWILNLIGIGVYVVYALLTPVWAKTKKCHRDILTMVHIRINLNFGGTFNF